MNLRKDHCHAPNAATPRFCEEERPRGSNNPRAARRCFGSWRRPNPTTNPVNPQTQWPRGASGPSGRAARHDSPPFLPPTAARPQGRERRERERRGGFVPPDSPPLPKQTPNTPTPVVKLNSRTDGVQTPQSAKTSNEMTTFSNGYLGSCNDEERSEMRYVMRIAEL